MEEEIKLKYIDVKEFKKELYSYYLEIFPEVERKPLWLVRFSYKKGYTQIIEILDNNTLIGFMLLNRVKDKEYAVLDYLAILPEYRNKGYGTKALELLIEQEKENAGIFIEIEKSGLGKDEEENLLREKRKSFYESLGFKELNFDLFLFDETYTPYVFSNIKIDEENIIKEIINIYESISGKRTIKRNCKITRHLRFVELSKDNIDIAAKVQFEIFPTSSAYSIYKAKDTEKKESFYVSYIAYLQDKPVGVIGLYEIPEYPDTAWISWFGLKKEYRKSGFGKQMIDFIIEIAKKKGRKFLRLYTYEIWNNEAQAFYKRNMDIGEYYYNKEETRQELFKGKPKVFSKSLCEEKVEPWNNKFIDISEDEDSHPKSVQMMKEDGIII